MSKLTKEIYHNCGPKKLMAVAKASEYKEARFAIDFKGKICVCNGYRFVHDDMIPYDDMKHHGYVFWNHENDTYRFWTYENKDDPILDTFVERGIENHNRRRYGNRR